MLGDEEEDDDEVGEVLTLPLQAHHAMEKMEEFVHKVNTKLHRSLKLFGRGVNDPQTSCVANRDSCT